MASEDSRLRLIPSGAPRSTGMSAPAPRTPLFPVPSNVPSRSCEENVAALGPLAHVVEVKDGYALVHASPMGIARIAQELGLAVFTSRKGGEYYAVRVGLASAQPVPVAPVSAPRIVERSPSPQAQASLEPGVVRLDIRGTNYVVRQTRTKRSIDVLRYEVRKDAGDVITEPYVVSFQDAAGRSGACSCPDWIYRRREKGDCKHIHGVRAALVARRQETIPLSIAN